MKTLRQLRTAAGFGAVVCRAAADYRRMCGRGTPTFIQRSDWLHRWSREGLRSLRIEVESAGDVPCGGLIVANHLSYLDVLVLSSIAPCAFVSKSEVAHWPLVGWLTRIAGTIYIDRRSRKDTHRVGSILEERLSAGEAVVVFPEGTSSDGSSVLPFHSSLLQAAISAGQRITPTHLSYLADGADAATGVCYWGDMTFATHLWKLFGIERVQARVRLGGADTYTDRKVAARECRQRVLQLAYAS